MEPLASASWLARMHPRLAGLNHVVSTVSECLDMSARLSPPQAAATGNVFLFHRVLRRVQITPRVNLILCFHWMSQAMQKAIEGGHFAMVKYIHKVHPEPLAVTSFRVALRCGQIEILDWLCDHRCDQLCIDAPPTLAGISSVSCCLLLRCMYPGIVTRDVPALRWLYESNCIKSLSHVGDMAAATCDLEMVEWLYERARLGAFTPEAISAVVRRGHLPIVQFLHQHGLTEYASEDLLAEAVGRGHTQVAEYLKLNNICTTINPTALMGVATSHGRLEVLEEYLMACDEPVAKELALYIPVRAAEYGHLPVLQLVHEHQLCEFTRSVVARAAASGCLDMVQWLHAHYTHLFPPSKAIENAASRGHLGIVQWLHEHTTVKCTKAAMDGAAYGGHLDVVKWLHENRTEGCTKAAMSAVVRNGDVEMAVWFHENRTEGCSLAAIGVAVQKGDLEMVIWLYEHGYKGLTEGLMRTAPTTIVMWLHETLGFAIDSHAIAHAVATSDLLLLKWLHERSIPRFPLRTRPRLYRRGLYPHINIITWMRANRPEEVRENRRRTRRRLL